MAGVRDDRDGERFVLEEDGEVAELVYRRHGDRLVLIHTGVPDAIGGRGIGGRLVAAAVERARADHLTIVPYCPYARRWLQSHPEVAGSVTVDWPPEDGEPAR